MATLQSHARENCWYVLATSNGEINTDSPDSALISENASTWNGLILSNSRTLKKEDINNYEQKIEIGNLDKIGDYTKTRLAGCNKKNIEDIFSDEIIDMSNLIFDKRINLSGFIFDRELKIWNSKFQDDLVIENSIFFGKVDFQDCEFEKSIIFRNCSFVLGSKFIKLKISEKATLRELHFFGDAVFDGTHFMRETDFTSTEFKKDIKFINTQFDNITNFRGSKFEKYVPDFRGAKMHDATTWRGASWPSVPSRKDSNITIEHIERYYRLKQEMERLKKFEDVLFFFRKNLRAKRNLYDFRGKGLTYFILNLLYEKISRYGDSVIYPLAYYFLILTVGALMYLYFYNIGGNSIDFILSIRISAANMTLFPQVKPLALNPEHYEFQPIIVKVMSTFQSMTSVVLLFLIGLAIKNRFGIK